MAVLSLGLQSGDSTSGTCTYFSRRWRFQVMYRRQQSFTILVLCCRPIHVWDDSWYVSLIRGEHRVTAVFLGCSTVKTFVLHKRSAGLSSRVGSGSFLSACLVPCAKVEQNFNQMYFCVLPVLSHFCREHSSGRRLQRLDVLFHS